MGDSEIILKDKNAIFIYIVDNNIDEIVGGAYFDLSKDEANYSVGVYRRDLSTQPLGHMVQDRAITIFLRLGIKDIRLVINLFKLLIQNYLIKIFRLLNSKVVLGQNCSGRASIK